MRQMLASKVQTEKLIGCNLLSLQDSEADPSHPRFKLFETLALLLTSSTRLMTQTLTQTYTLHKHTLFYLLFNMLWTDTFC